MKNLALGIAIVITFTLVGFGQSTKKVSTSGAANTSASASKSGKDISLASNTAIAAQLQKSLSADKARVGDQVVLKTTKAVKQNGEVVVAKGSKLIGRVTDVQRRARGNATSRIGLLFDTLVQNGQEFSINAFITSVTQVNSQSQNDGGFSDMSSSGSAGSSTGSSSTSGGGGLLGGVGNTVGGVLNTTTQTVGGVTNTVGQTVGGTVNGLQISQSANAEVSGSSTLSLTGSNIRLEKGTTFNFRVSESASVNDSN